MKKLATTVALTALFSTMMVYDANAGILSRNNTITAANLQAAFGGNIAIAKNWKTTESKILYDIFCTAKKAFTKKLSTFSKTKAEKTFNELLSLLEKALIDIYQCENEKTLTKKTTNLVSYWTQKYDTVGSINSVQNLPNYDLETFSNLSELLNQDKFAVFKETFLNLNLPDQFWTKSGTPVVEGAKKTFGIILILQCLMGKDDPRATVATSSNFTPEYSSTGTAPSSSSSSEEGNWMFNGNSSTTPNNTTTAPVTFQGTPATAVNLNETQTTDLAAQQAAAAEAAKKQAEEQAAQQLAAQQQQQATILAAQQAAVQQLIQQATAAVSNVKQIIPQVQNNLASRQYAMAERLAQQAVQQASVAQQFSQQAIQQATASQQATLIQQANATHQAVQQIAQQAASLQASVTQTISQLRGSYLRAYQLQKQQLR